MEHNIVHNECNMKLIVGGEGSVRIPSLIDQISKRSKGAIFFLLFAICTTFWSFIPYIPDIQKSKKSKGVICYWPLSVNIVDKGKWSPFDQIDHISENPNIMAPLFLSLCIHIAHPRDHHRNYLINDHIEDKECIEVCEYQFTSLGHIETTLRSYRGQGILFSPSAIQGRSHSVQFLLVFLISIFLPWSFFKILICSPSCCYASRDKESWIPRYEILLVNYNSICWCKLWWSALWGLMHPSKKNWTSSNYLTMSSIYVFQSAGSPLCEYAHQYKEGIYLCSGDYA